MRDMFEAYTFDPDIPNLFLFPGTKKVPGYFPGPDDANEIRTRDTTVKGWCLNRLTMGPHLIIFKNENNKGAMYS